MEDTIRRQTIAVVLLNHFPGHPEKPLFNTHEGFFAALQAWIPCANTLDRVGVREISPGVWTGHHTRISPTAVLQAPCWIGQHCRIEAHAVIAGGSIIENGAVVDQAAEIRASHVGPRTYVGKFADLHESFAWEDTLLNWRSGSTRKSSRSVYVVWLASAAKFKHRTSGQVE